MPEFALADGILQLAYEPHEPLYRRWLRVVKMRGSSPLSGKHTFRIGRAGIEVFPRSSRSCRRRAACCGWPDLERHARARRVDGRGLPVADATAILDRPAPGRPRLRCASSSRVFVPMNPASTSRFKRLRTNSSRRQAPSAGTGVRGRLRTGEASPRSAGRPKPRPHRCRRPTRACLEADPPRGDR